MNKLYIVVDMQNDFITGSLGSKAAEKIVPTVTDVTTKAIQNGDKVIFTQDTHQTNYMNTQEGERLPIPHCIENSKGWEIIPVLQPLAEKALITIKKPTFGSLSLIDYIRHNCPNVEEIILIGVCTDICVISNALLIKAAFPETRIVIYEDACAGVTPETHEAALITAKSCQIDILKAKKED